MPLRFAETLQEYDGKKDTLDCWLACFKFYKAPETKAIANRKLLAK